MNTDTLLIFTAASFVLAVTPGPTMLLALSNGISGGMRRARWGIVGASLGSTVVIATVALGLGSLLAASEWLFNALRAHFDTAQLVGLTHVVTLGNLRARFNVALGIGSSGFSGDRVCALPDVGGG